MNNNGILINLVGNRYGRLTVISRASSEKAGAYWLCKCDCGNDKVIRANSLKSGNTKSCGCLHKSIVSTRTLIDETGNRYGKLVVVRQVEDGRRGAHWLCKCDCGGEKIVSGVALRNGHTLSCGCLPRAGELNALPFGDAAFNELYANIKKGAIRRGHSWELSADQVRHLAKQPCYYCGELPKQVSNGKYRGDFIYNGLDRVDNEIGYLVENVVTCCKHCNRAKRAMSINAFSEWVMSVYKRFGSKIYEKPISALIATNSNAAIGKEQEPTFTERVTFNRLYSRIKRDAKRRDYAWGLSKPELEKLVQQPCYYCGRLPEQICGNGDKIILYNGLDRVDNDKGYLKDNVVPCCKNCNYAKLTRRPERFYEWIRMVHKCFIPKQESARVVKNA